MSVLTMLFTFRLFSPENMLSFAICIMPVTTPSLSELLPFNADVWNPLMKSSISRWHGLPYDSFTGESYSSMRATTFLPCFDSRMPMRLSRELISIPRLAVRSVTAFVISRLNPDSPSGSRVSGWLP